MPKQEATLIKNKAGRLVPNRVNGVKATPFKGVGKQIIITSKDLTSIWPTLIITIPGFNPACWAELSSLTDVITTPAI